MAYCTQADIQRRIGLTDLTSLADHDDDDSPDAAVVAQAIGDAQGDLDSYLQKKYTVPVSPVPPVLRKHCVNMAVYYLQLGRDSVTENWRKAFDDATKWVKDVVAGKAELGVDPKPTESPGAASVRSTAKPRLFGRDKSL